MPFISQRRPRGPGRFLRWKMWLFSVGAILLLVGMARNLDLLVGAAIAVLAVAFLLRFFERDEDDGDDDEGADEDEYEEGEEPEDGAAFPSSEVVKDEPMNEAERRQPVD